jgi:hypothetical protein
MPAFAKRLAAAQSPNGKQPSVHHAKPLYRFDGILRTGGSKAATGRRQHRNAALIKPN